MSIELGSYARQADYWLSDICIFSLASDLSLERYLRAHLIRTIRPEIGQCMKELSPIVWFQNKFRKNCIVLKNGKSTTDQKMFILIRYSNWRRVFGPLKNIGRKSSGKRQIVGNSSESRKRDISRENGSIKAFWRLFQHSTSICSLDMNVERTAFYARITVYLPYYCNYSARPTNHDANR